MNKLPKKLTLIIDTSSEKSFVVLIREGKVVGEKTWDNSPDVGRRVLEVVDGLLQEAKMKLGDIGIVAVQVGLGRYYSSLRAGVTVANMLAYALGTGVVGLRGGSKDEVINEALGARPVKMVLPWYDS